MKPNSDQGNDSARRRDARSANADSPTITAISSPKGGGAIRGMGEKFAANPATGTGLFSIPIFNSQERAGFGPQLGLSYDSAKGNGACGLGWGLELLALARSGMGLVYVCDAHGVYRSRRRRVRVSPGPELSGTRQTSLTSDNKNLCC